MSLGKSHEFRRTGSDCKIFERDGVCQPRLACANGVADGRKSFSEHLFPWPPTWFASLEAVCPKTDDPHGVKRAGFSQSAGVQKVFFHGRVLGEFGKGAC